MPRGRNRETKLVFGSDGFKLSPEDKAELMSDANLNDLVQKDVEQFDEATHRIESILGSYNAFRSALEHAPRSTELRTDFQKLKKAVDPLLERLIKFDDVRRLALATSGAELQQTIEILTNISSACVALTSKYEGHGTQTGRPPALAAHMIVYALRSVFNDIQKPEGESPGADKSPESVPQKSHEKGFVTYALKAANIPVPSDNAECWVKPIQHAPFKHIGN